MKKILSLLLMLFVSVGIWAETITFDATQTTSGNTSASAQSITLDGITIHVTNGILGTTDGQYRCYKSQTMTISSTVGNITNIELTCTASGTEKYGPGCFTNTGTGDYTYSDNVGTWTGSASEISLFAELNQVRMTQIIVTYEPGQVTPPEPPTITEVSTIAELNALDDNTEFKFNGTSVCVWSFGQYTYIQDATAATLIYGTLPEGITYNITDVLQGGWQGKKTTYNELPEIINVTGLVAATSVQNVPATEINIANISANDYAKYVVVKNVLITVDTPEPPEPPTPSGHELTYSIIGVTGTTYTAWSNVQGGTSVAKYAGKTAGGNEAIQMRSSKNEDGIVTTTSAGNVKNVSVLWNTNTAATRTVSIYGKNEAYNSAADLYNENTQGDLLGELNIDDSATSTTITVSGNYAYWGIRSKSGALWLDAIDVEWDNGNTTSKAQTVTVQKYTLTDQNGNELTAYPSKLGYMEVPDDLTQRYDVYGVLDFYNGEAQILPIGFEDENGTVTSIETTNNVVKKVTYYNMQGIESSKPFDGLNIIVTEYENGTKKINKQIYSK